MKKPRFTSKTTKSLLDGKSNPPRAERRFLSFNFKDLDTAQCCSFKTWQKKGFLADACERMRGYSSNTIPQCFSRSFRYYDKWPAHSGLKKPNHVPDDAKWASMHIHGKICLGGHIVHDTFYVVFLDENHNLWPCKGKK